MEKKQNKKIPLALKILFIFTGIIILSVILFSVWFFLPVKEVSPSALLAPDTAVYFSINFGSKSPGMLALKSRAKDLVLSSHMSSLQKTIAKIALSSFFPRQVSGIFTVDKDSNTQQMAGFAGFHNEIKLIKLFKGYFEKALFRGEPLTKQWESGHPYTTIKDTGKPTQKQLPVTTYAFFGNTLCMGTEPALMQGIINNYTHGYSPFPGLKAMAETVTQDQEGKDGYFYMDNMSGQLSKMVQVVEEKLTFAAFPSIDTIERITGYLWLSETELKGTVKFACRNTGALENVGSDVKFFYQALRRLLKPWNLTLSGEISSSRSMVVLDFTIENFLEDFFAYIKENQGGEK